MPSLPVQEVLGPQESADAAGGVAAINLAYDAMPIDFITGIVTEFGLIPPTSVPVILREKQDDDAAARAAAAAV
jgi:translation initiation factor 2B subunit (eIF-2B alpha/beta/delta family)